MKISLSGESITNGCSDDNLMGGLHSRLLSKMKADARRRAMLRGGRRRGGIKRRSFPIGVPRRMRGEEDEVIFMGFDRMTDEEIMYSLDRSPYQEYMGGKVKDWFKRRKVRAQALVKKIKAKYKALPKWAKIATGAFAAPLALAAAPAALATAPLLLPKAIPAVATALIAKRAKKEKELLAKMTPEERKAYLKKKAKRLGIAASILIPGFGITAATTAGTFAIGKKIAKTVAARKQAQLAAQQQAQAESDLEEPLQEQAYNQAQYSPAPAQMQTVPLPQDQQSIDQETEAQPAEQKKSGMGALLGLGALAALPFIL